MALSRRSIPWIKTAWAFALSLRLLGVGNCAEVEKRPLSFEDFDGWRSISTPMLSRDGQWLAYSFMPARGDGEVIVRQLSPKGEKHQYSTAAGELPPPPFPQMATPSGRTPPPKTVDLLFTGDSQFLLSLGFPSAETRKQVRLGNLEKEAERRGLTIVDLVKGRSELVREVHSVQVSTQSSWIAYLHEAEVGPLTHQLRRNSAIELREPKKPNQRLVVQQLGRRGKKTFEYVTDYSISRDGRMLLFTVKSARSRANGLYLYATDGAGGPKSLLRTPNKVGTLTWDVAQAQLAFWETEEGQEGKAPTTRLHLWQRGAVASESIPLDLPEGLRLSEHSSLRFSRDGKKLFVGLALSTSPEASEVVPEDPIERSYAELWRWDDPLITPRRRVLADTERKRSTPGVLDLRTRRFTPLGSLSSRELRFSEAGRWALALDEAPYFRERDYDGTYADIYSVNIDSGEHHLLIQKLRGSSGDEGLPLLYFSPNGERAAYFSEAEWWSVDLATGRSHCLTASLPVSFADEWHDKPEPPPAYGWAGWLADSSAFIVYDRYDLWRLGADEIEPLEAQCLTRGWGREQRVVLRLQDIAVREPDEPRVEESGIDPSQPLILRGESEQTRDSGFFRQSMTGEPRSPQQLLWGEKNYRYVTTAKLRGEEPLSVLLSASRFDEFPDLWLTNGGFSSLQKITHGSTQLAPFPWGTAELIDYSNSAGVPLQGLLLKPPDFDPSQKYPLVVFLYERLSQLRHNFFAPVYGSNINFPFYVSNGYLVYLVDIAYAIGAPGASALDSVDAALDAVLPQGFVDEARLGIQGSSWGGYQAAYIVTQSDRFRAAVVGSPVGNMTSAYAGIRWSSGQARLFQYEQTQSRIGAPLLDEPERYLANSPVFQIRGVDTPLLIMHNEADGAVPWAQSIELFLALRRHRKQAWFFNYAHEAHGLVRYANRQDFNRRTWAFFEHYLRDAPRPDWMKDR